MSVDPKTYNFCLQSLRYIHDILGTDTVIKELHFLDHLQPITLSPQTNSTQTNDTTLIPSNTPHIPTDPLNETIHEPTKSVTIDKSMKYQRNSCPDDRRCHANKNTGQRCTFKAENDSTLCSRHRQKTLLDTNTS